MLLHSSEESGWEALMLLQLPQRLEKEGLSAAKISTMQHMH
jgi:hypothetical protein